MGGGGNLQCHVAPLGYTRVETTTSTTVVLRHCCTQQDTSPLHFLPSLSKMVRSSALPAALVVLASSSCTAFVAPLAPARVSTAPSMSLKGPAGRSSSPISKATGIVSKVSQPSTDRREESKGTKATSRTELLYCMIDRDHFRAPLLCTPLPPLLFEKQSRLCCLRLWHGRAFPPSFPPQQYSVQRPESRLHTSRESVRAGRFATFCNLQSCQKKTCALQLLSSSLPSL